MGKYLIKLCSLFLQRVFDTLYVACRGVVRFKQAVNVKSVARLCRHSAGGGVRLLQISAGLKLCHLVSDSCGGAGKSAAFAKIFASDGLAVVNISLNDRAQYQALSVCKTVCVRFHRFLLVLYVLVFSTLAYQVLITSIIYHFAPVLSIVLPNIFVNILLICAFSAKMQQFFLLCAGFFVPFATGAKYCITICLFCKQNGISRVDRKVIFCYPY